MSLTRTLRRYEIQCALAVILLGLSCRAFSQTSAVERSAGETLPPLAAQSIPPTYFGLHVERADSITPWPAVPFGSWRLWDAGVSWWDLELARGHWNFKVLDRDVALAEEHKVGLLLTLGLTPRWASSKPDERGYAGLGSGAMPKDIADWRNYVRVVALRYKGRIHEYEIWNEPNLRPFFSGSVNQMLLLTREAARILKEVDPSNVVVSPSANAGRGVPADRLIVPGEAWLNEFLKKGGGTYVDVVAHHFYVTPGPPEGMVPMMRQVRGLLDQYGLRDKPLWNTETGWMIQNKSGTVRPWGSFREVLSPAMAADYVARSYILNWVFGSRRFYWYSWDNPGFGLTEANGSELKPGAKAYARVEDWLVGAKPRSCQFDKQDTWSCEFQSKDGLPFWIVWNPKRQVSLSPPQQWQTTHWVKLSGASGRFSPQAKIRVTGSPILLAQ